MTYPLPLGFQHTQYCSACVARSFCGVWCAVLLVCMLILCAFGSDDVESSEQAMRDGLDDSLIDAYRGIIERTSCIVSVEVRVV